MSLSVLSRNAVLVDSDELTIALMRGEGGVFGIDSVDHIPPLHARSVECREPIADGMVSNQLATEACQMRDVTSRFITIAYPEPRPDDMRLQAGTARNCSAEDLAGPETLFDLAAVVHDAREQTSA